MITFSKRLKAIADVVPHNAQTGDIGSDHGYLTYDLFDKKIITKGYASDNKSGPFSRLQKTFEDTDYDVTLALVDGINDLPNWVDTLIITGMGGELITNILFSKEHDLTNIKTMILSPQGNEIMLRQALNNHHFCIKDEKIVKDDKYYLIMVVIPGEESLTDLEQEFGKINLQKQEAEFKNMLKTDYAYHEDLLKIYQVDAQRKADILLHLQRIDEALNYGK